MKKMTKQTWPFFLAVLGLLAGCEATETGLQWNTDPKQATTPTGSQPLVQLSDGDVQSAVALAKTGIEGYRDEGIRQFSAALKEALTRRNIQADDVVNQLNDSTTILTQPLPSFWQPAKAASSQSSALSQQRFALVNGDVAEYVQYYSCPLDAPDRVSDTCDQLIADAMLVLQAKVEEAKKSAQDILAEMFPGMPAASQDFILAWVEEAMAVGGDVAAVNAKYMLGAAKKCSTKLTDDEIAYELGLEQGMSFLAEDSDLHEWAEAQNKGCLINSDDIATTVQGQAEMRVESFVTYNPLCKDSDLSLVNTGLQRVLAKRKEGIKAGIKLQTKMLRNELFDQQSKYCCDSPALKFEDHPWEGVKPTPEKMWGDGTCATDAAGWSYKKLSTPASGYSYAGQGGYNYPGSLIKVTDTTGIEMCCRYKGSEIRCVANQKVQGNVLYAVQWGSNDYWTWSCTHQHVGSPLVIDLDDDGLNMSDSQVAFDLLATGGAQCKSWVGPREGFLALDLNRNERIDSGRELFGNYTTCGARTCLDGVEALAAWDQADKGGNADGRIDAQDAVYAQLRLWIDVNQDGVSQPEEISSLAEHGVLALDLEADRSVVRGEHGAVSARLPVLTSEGFRTAHDVWFNLNLQPADLVTQLPRL